MLTISLKTVCLEWVYSYARRYVIFQTGEIACFYVCMVTVVMLYSTNDSSGTMPMHMPPLNRQTSPKYLFPEFVRLLNN